MRSDSRAPALVWLLQPLEKFTFIGAIHKRRNLGEGWVDKLGVGPGVGHMAGTKCFDCRLAPREIIGGGGASYQARIIRAKYGNLSWFPTASRSSFLPKASGS